MNRLACRDLTAADEAAPSDSLMRGSASLVVGAIVLAIVVYLLGSWRLKKQLNDRALRPNGRRHARGTTTRAPGWAKTVARLRTQRAADARSGPVQVHGKLVGASAHLGGAEGFACVWRNRAGAGVATAVAAQTVFLRDDSGMLAIEGLERAYVITAAERTSIHHEHVALYLGDEVEVCGQFTAVGTENADVRVYGTLTFVDGLDVRLVSRPQRLRTPSNTSTP